MTIGRLLITYLALALVIITPGACSQNPIFNLSFEVGLSGLYGWSAYPYEVWGGDDAMPVAGTLGPPPCTFNVLPTASIPDGARVCGLESLGDQVEPAEPARNGGVFQSFTWTGGAAEVVVSGRAYSEDEDPFWGGWGPYDNGCRVQIGLAGFETANPGNVPYWSEIPWGSSDTWQTASVSVQGPGTYTLFIRAYQPGNSGWTTTLWDNVRWILHPAITSGPTVSIGDDPSRPDTTARIRWTTDVPTTSRVDYGFTTAYGSNVDDAALTTDHSVLLENLTPSGKYHFRVTSGAPDAVDVVSGDVSFDMPIQFSNITASTEGLNVVVRWHTDIPTTSRVEYGYTSDYGLTTDPAPALVTDHEVIISGLDEVQLYHYRVWATAPLCTAIASSDKTFTTLPNPKSSLENPSFESWETGLYPWVQYPSSVSGAGAIDGLLGPYPSGGPETWSSAGIQAYDGSYFLGAAANVAYKGGGFFQRIFWPSGQICSLCARIATRSVGGGFYDTRARLGIDPDGGLDPASSRIVWWSGFSQTEDNQWYPGGVTATAGPGGIVTVFLDIRQYYPINTHVVAIDDVTFGIPTPTLVGALKQERRSSGAQVDDAIVTLVASNVLYEGVNYTKAYVQPYGSIAGIAVLLTQNAPDPPYVGDRVTLRGTLMTCGMEAAIIAYDWTLTPGPFQLPSPFAMSQQSVGGGAHNQPALYASKSVCNVGSRMRLWGRVTGNGQDALTFYIDDGSKLLEHAGGTARGVRVRLAGDVSAVHIGDYVTATGVLTINLVDPNGIPGSGDEYGVYTLLTDSQYDWTSFTP